MDPARATLTHTVYHQLGPSCEARVVTEQKQDSLGDLFTAPHTLDNQI